MQKNKISLLRLNMSHLNVSNFKKTIKFIRKYTATNLLESMVEHNCPTKVEANNNLWKFLGVADHITLTKRILVF